MRKLTPFYLVLLITSVFQTVVTSYANAADEKLIKLDDDLDGYISIREAIAEPVLLASFGRVDTDGDGKVSEEEFTSSSVYQHIDSRVSDEMHNPN